MKAKPKKVVELLKQRSLTLSTAESCTGGLIAKYITDIPGSSEVFLGGVVSYTDEVKMKVLGVKEKTLDNFGAVSHQVAQEMACGVKGITSSNIAVSTTGIAGPGGGSNEHPVGTVFIGIAYKDKCESARLSLNPSYSREKIREETVKEIFNLIVAKISENY